MEINILLEVLNPNNHTQLPDTPVYKLNGFQYQQKTS